MSPIFPLVCFGSLDLNGSAAFYILEVKAFIKKQRMPIQNSKMNKGMLTI